MLCACALQYEREATSCAQLRARLAALEAALESAAGMAAPRQDYSPHAADRQQPRPAYQDVNVSAGLDADAACGLV
jgi:hypothetical protein